MSNQWYPMGGNGGLPSDMLTSEEIGQRRLKTSSRNELVEVIEDGFAYSFSGSYPSVDGEIIAVNIAPASEIILRRVTANIDFKIEVYDEEATGSADGILAPSNLNLTSVDVSPASAQIYYTASAVGTRLEVGYGEIDPFIITDTDNRLSVLMTNNSGTAQDVDFVVIYEEIGERSGIFGLTPSTFLEPTTEMSDYG